MAALDSSTSAGWHLVGRTEDFPNITSSDSGLLTDIYSCGDGKKLGCKAFSVSGAPEDSSPGVEVDLDDAVIPASLKEQVLVFQYNGKFHAIDHRCPHSSYPLSKGSVFDIEDFGVVLSAGISCPKHGWSFDLFMGQADRSGYVLRRWDVDLRPIGGGSGAGDTGYAIREVWVRRKQA